MYWVLIAALLAVDLVVLTVGVVWAWSVCLCSTVGSVERSQEHTPAKHDCYLWMMKGVGN
jgi:hypothetical protein